MSQNRISPVVPLAPKPAISYVAVDPAMATRLLGNNKVNRSLRHAKVNQYAGDMAAGRWTLSNDAICIAPDGRLLNGQHRLHAVIKSGVPTMLLIARNMPPESMTNMDIGSSRTAADALRWAGEINVHGLAAAAKLALLHASDRLYRDSKVQAVSPAEIQEFVNANPLIRHSAHVIAGVKARIDAPPSALAAAHYIIADTTGVAPADHYLQQLANRSGEPEGSAVLAVDSRLRQLRYKRSTYAPRVYMGLLIKGWNHYAKDSRVAVLTVPGLSSRIPTPIRWQR